MCCYLFHEFYTLTQTSHSIYDWSKDIWLPAAGAIAIPLLVWWLSWLFGASRAEQQKELRDLRNNLNLLSSILLSTFQSLLSLKENFENCQKVYPLKISPYDKMNKLDKCLFIDFPILNNIDISKYSPCINAYGNFIIDLVNIKQGCCVLNGMILHRNEVLKSIGSCEDDHVKELRIFDFIAEDSESNVFNLMRTNKLILEIKELVDKINILKTKIKGLNLEEVTFDENSLQQFKNIKLEIEKFIQDTKEPNK